MSNEPQDNLEERIAAYIDGELPPAEAARLEVYLANTDAKLAEAVINMIGDRHRLKSLPKESAPDDLAARIMEQVERTSLLHNVDQLAPTRRPWWQTRAAAAALLFLVLGGFTYYMLHALQPASPEWQAALETSPSTHLPTIAAAPSGTALPASTTPSRSTIAQMAQLDVLKKREAEDKVATGPAAAEPAAANGTLALAGADAALQRRDQQKQDKPVVLAFVARDANDFVRLQSLLDTVTPPGVAADAPAPGPLHEEQLAQQNGAGGRAAEASAAPSNTNASATAAPLPDQAAQSQRQSQSTNQAANQARNQYANQGEFGMANSKGEGQKDLATAGNTIAPTIPAPSAAAAKPTPQMPVTYHVALRTTDIEALTQQFQPAAATTDHVTDDNAASIAGESFSRAAPATAPAETFKAASAGDARIDCIITMTPPPAATQPTTSP